MSPLVAYLLQSIGWAGAGFLGGVLVGRTARDVHKIAQAVEPDDGATMPSDQPAPQRRTRWPSQTVIAIIVVLLGVLTVVQGIVQSQATERLTRCQASYSNAFADALDARSSASSEAQDALDQLATTVGNALQGSQDARTRARAAISDYLAKRQALKRQQAAHPYPAPPRAACP